jgi:4-hydroxybenzoyl-CoA thioesterase
MVFTAAITVRFAHVDAAGIVFYPRYIEMLNEVVERWFDEALKTSFHKLHVRQGRGAPARHLEFEFLKASRLGDVLRFELTVVKVGTTSVNLAVTGKCKGQERTRARLTLVYASLDPLKPLPWPKALRSRMAKFAVAAKTRGAPKPV